MKNTFHKFHSSKFNSEKMQKNFIFFDTETFEIEKEGRKELSFKLGSFLVYHRDTNFVYKKVFYDCEKFWIFIDFLFSKERNNYILYAHNLTFDLTISDSFNCLSKLKWELTSFYNKGKVSIFIFKKFAYQDKQKRKYYYTLHCWDTINYFSSSPEKLQSVEEIGELVNLPKLKIDFQKCSNEELEIYCLRDSEILFEFVKYLIDFLLKYELCSRLKATGGGLSLAIFRTKFYNEKKQPIFIHNHKKSIDLERNSYRGGITDVFLHNQRVENCYKLDINSMYSSQMKMKKFPIKLLYYSHSAKKTQEELMTLFYFVQENQENLSCIMNIDYELKEGLVLNKKETKSQFLRGNKLNGSFCYPELMYIQEFGRILRINEITIYRIENIFENFVDFFYEKRIQWKKENQLLLVEFCKIILNNLYGKWGQTEQEVRLVTKKEFIANYPIFKQLLEKQLVFSENSFIYLGTIIDFGEFYLISNKLYVLEKKKENTYDALVAIASFVTSNSRLLLISYIEKAKIENVFYCDTDSLFANESGYQNLIKEGLINQLELGKLKQEGLGSAIFYAPKFYDFWENGIQNRRIKGVGLKRSILLEETSEFAEYFQDLWMRIKARLKEGKIKNQIILLKQKKRVKKEYTKGIVGENHRTIIDFIE